MTSSAGYDDPFCPECGVDLGLHLVTNPEPEDCLAAAAKADLLEQFGPLFGGYR